MKPVYDAWVQDINKRSLSTIDGHLFEIVRLRGGANFDPQVITLFIEVRNLLDSGFNT
jgi:hypothetical protein